MIFSLFNLKERRSKQKGFTLVEALISFSILAMAFGAFISSTTTAMKSFEYAEERHLASKMAQEGIELAINKKNNFDSCAKDPQSSEFQYCQGETWLKDIDFDGSYEVSSARPEELLPREQFSGYDNTVWKPRNICFLEGQTVNPGGQTPGSVAWGDLSHIGKFGYCKGKAQQRDGEGNVIPGNFKRKVEFTDLTESNSELITVLVESTVLWDNGELTLAVVLYNRE